MPTPATYSKTQIALHWIVVVLVAFQIFFHQGIAELWHSRMTGALPDQATPTPHTIVGIIILVLMLWRLWLRLRHGVPALPASEPPLLKGIAHATHWLFYLLLIGMPISGAVAWFGGLPQPAAAHALAEKILIPLIVLHILAALAQHFWFKTDVMKRMAGKA